MPTLNKPNLIKKDISKKIHLILGFSNLYVDKITNDFIKVLKICIKEGETNIKNFGSFKCIHKNARLGRNPKNKRVYKITSRISLSFIPSKKLNDRINIY